MAQVETETAEDRTVTDADDPLQWLSAILWPGGGAGLRPDRRHGLTSANSPFAVGGDGDRRRVGDRWWGWPTAAEAELLIPATSIAAARTAVRRYHDGFTLGRRARSWSAELLMRVPKLASKTLDGRLVVAAGSSDKGLLTDLVSTLAPLGPIDDVDDLHVAITLARPKSNRKPVLQLIDRNGACIGWAKIGWNDWTTALVANEADWLDRAARSPIAAPRMLGRQQLGGHLVVVSSGVVGGRRPRRVSTEPPPPDLFHSITDVGTRSRARLTDTPWWQTVEAVRSHATEAEARAIDRVVDDVGTAELDIGAWHGDLTPWNIMSSAGTTHVIDWEFAADGAPFGFDLCHFHTQVGAEMKGMSTSEALDRSARLSPQGLARLGVNPHNQINVYRLYLVELIRRTLALRAAGQPVEWVEHGRAAADRIALASGDNSEDRTACRLG